MGFIEADRLMLMAELRLFANLQTPTYHVVVGDIRGSNHIKAAISWPDIRPRRAFYSAHGQQFIGRVPLDAACFAAAILGVLALTRPLLSHQTLRPNLS